MTTLILDIETGPGGWREHTDGLPPEAHEHAREWFSALEPPKNYKKPESIERWFQEQRGRLDDVAAQWWRDGALDPKRGEVVCIGLRWVGEDAAWVIEGDSEKDVMRSLGREFKARPPTAIVAHNGEGFDFPYLFERAVALGMPQVARWFTRLRYSQARALGIRQPAELIDTLQLMPGPYYRRPGEKAMSRGTLSALCALCGVEHDDSFGGSDVIDALTSPYTDTSAADVVSHCRDDVDSLHDLWVHHIAPALGVEEA